jgi:hypothetical protein
MLISNAIWEDVGMQDQFISLHSETAQGKPNF